MEAGATVEWKGGGDRGRCVLGEGAIWDPHSQRLLFVDINEGLLFTYNTETKTCESEASFTQHIGTVVPVSGDDVVIAAVKGIAVVKRATGEPVSVLASPESDAFSLRWNDGKCDPRGRLWVGSMHLQFGKPWATAPAGALWSLERSNENLKVVKRIENISISNGIVWNKNADTMYYIDTPTMQVDAFDYDADTGKISNRRCAIRVPAAGTDGFMGYPDGCTIADDDTIFVAFWEGSCVARFNPASGELMQKFPIPGASRITSCAFGGPNLDQLFVTSASTGVKEADLANKEINAGCLFRIDLSGQDYKGVPAFSYKM